MTAEPTIGKHWTVADYMALDDDQRYEVLEGELRMVPAPGRAHQRVITRLGTIIDAYVEEHRLGYCFHAPFDVVLADDTVVQPDFTFVLEEHIEQRDDGHGVTGPPDLVIEVLSPSSARLDRTRKRSIYAKAKVPWLVLVDPNERTVEVFRLQDPGEYVLDASAGEDDELTLGILPGLVIPLSTIWFPRRST